MGETKIRPGPVFMAMFQVVMSLALGVGLGFQIAQWTRPPVFDLSHCESVTVMLYGRIRGLDKDSTAIYGVPGYGVRCEPYRGD